MPHDTDPLAPALGASRVRPSYATLLRVQSLYYGVTGLWPLVHMRSFEAVTGPKRDDWLVRMVGLLTVAVAGTIWPSDRGDPATVPRPVKTLAIATAASYLLIDVVYAARRVISPVYLADAAFEAGLLVSHGLLRERAAASRG